MSLDKKVMDKSYAMYMAKLVEFKSLYGSRHSFSVMDDFGHSRYSLYAALRGLEELRIYKEIYDRCSHWQAILEIPKT